MSFSKSPEKFIRNPNPNRTADSVQMRRCEEGKDIMTGASIPSQNRPKTHQLENGKWVVPKPSDS